MSQDFYLSGVEEIARERGRQVSEEGFTAAHDDQHTDQSLALVAIHYATPPGQHIVLLDTLSGRTHPVFPRTWSRQWDKKKDHGRIRQLAIAGAECAAEIDRIKRKMIKDLAWLKKVHAANQAGQPGSAFTLDEIGDELVKRGFLEQRDGGLWITEDGKVEIITIMQELMEQIYPYQEEAPADAVFTWLEETLAKLEERQAGK